MAPKHDSIRGWFAAALHEEMSKNDKIWCLTGDLGYGMLDQIRDDFPKRFVNVGASEQAALGIGVGLALENRVPFVYSITTFLVYRAFEWVRNYMWFEDVPVRLIGSGMDADYEHDGISHQPFEVAQILDVFPNIEQYFPEEKEDVPFLVHQMVEDNKPQFMCLRR